MQLSDRINGHTAECALAMYRGPRVCICGADRPRRDQDQRPRWMDRAAKDLTGQLRTS